MTRPRPDLLSEMVTGKYIYGYTCPGFAYYGEFRPYPQQSIYGMDAYETQIVGFNIIDEFLPHCKKFAPLESLRAWKQFAGRTIFYKQHNRQYLMRYQPYHGAPKNHLEAGQRLLMEATFIWHLFDDATKRQLDIDASKQNPPGVGYNFFTKLYIKNDPRWETYV